MSFDRGDLGGALLFAVVVLALVNLIRWVLRNYTADGHWVYEIDLPDGTLWYIGECADITKRMKRHEQFQRGLPDGHPRKWWWSIDSKVRREYWPTRVSWYPSKLVAKDEERSRVRRKNPPGNRVKYKTITIVGGD
jgi:hypothetical protein